MNQSKCGFNKKQKLAEATVTSRYIQKSTT